MEEVKAQESLELKTKDADVVCVIAENSQKKDDTDLDLGSIIDEGVNSDDKTHSKLEERIDITDGEFNDADFPDNCCSRAIRRVQSSIGQFFHKRKKTLKIALYLTLLVLYSVYLTYALYYSFDGALALLAMTLFVVSCIVYAKIRDYFGESFSKLCRPLVRFCDRHWNLIRWVSGITALALVVLWIVLDTSKDPSNMRSFVGLITILVFCFLFSKHPDKIRWRPVDGDWLFKLAWHC
ncbi:solute carrier family 28 member 3-like isoform X2 [Ptychodera flava]|uniref:solute carrier family 28 member 3-like isoform X2 n=1 Tax=Ptychodera flava TaxID=63121 RepID=UPI00396A5E67